MFTIYVFFLFSTYCNMILSLLGSTGQILSKLSFSQYHANIATEKCNFNMYRLNLTKVFSYFAFDYLQNETNLNFVICCQREVNVVFSLLSSNALQTKLPMEFSLQFMQLIIICKPHNSQHHYYTKITCGKY